MPTHLLVFLILLPLSLAAAEVYKCTDPQGRIGFSQTPCPAQDQAQVLDIKPIDTIKAIPPDPKNLQYLEEYEQRRAEERKEQQKRQAEADKARREHQREVEAQRRHQETLDAIKSRPAWGPDYYPYSYPYYSPYPRIQRRGHGYLR